MVAWAVFRVTRFVVYLHRESIQCFQQVIDVVDYKVHQAGLERFRGGGGLGFIDHRFGQRERFFSARRHNIPDGSFGGICCLRSFI